MALFWVSMTILSCVSVGDSVRIRYANISVSVMEAVTPGSTFNTVASHVKGVFGTASLTGPVEGQLVHVHSENGLSRSGCGNYTHGVPTNNWVALIERGICTFSVKVKTATKRYKATAVIVYDNSPSDYDMEMAINDENEVYVFVSQADGKRLAQLVDSGLQVQVEIAAASRSSSLPGSSSAYPLAARPILSNIVAVLGLYLVFGQFE